MLQQGQTNYCSEESLSYESSKKLASFTLPRKDEEKCFLPINEWNQVNHKGRNTIFKLMDNVGTGTNRCKLLTDQIKQETSNLSIEGMRLCVFLQQK